MAYEQFVEDGRAEEVLVAQSIVNVLGGRIEWATRREDIEDHVDFWWLRPSAEHPGLYARVGVDVKGMRKLSRNDPNPSLTITWLELRNVNGGPGSLYGKAQYIAFVRLNDILIVDRIRLLEFAERQIAGKQVVTDRPSQCYVPYQRARWDREDLTFMAYLPDIAAIAERIIPKVPDDGL